MTLFQPEVEKTNNKWAASVLRCCFVRCARERWIGCETRRYGNATIDVMPILPSSLCGPNWLISAIKYHFDARLFGACYGSY